MTFADPSDVLRFTTDLGAAITAASEGPWWPILVGHDFIAIN